MRRVIIKDEWLRYLADVKARSGQEHYRNVIGISYNYVLPQCGEKCLQDMHLTDWQLIINTAVGRNGKTLAKKTLSNLRGVIVGFLIYCEKDDMDVHINTKLLYVPRAAPTVGKTILTPGQLRQLFEPGTGSEDMYIHYYRFLALTGMRPSEALGLKHEDVYDNIVVIRRAIVRGGKITSCKNKNARRIVGLNRQAVHELAAQNKLTANLCSEWIFPNQTGSKASQSTIQKHWDRLSERLETKASLYSFRHLYISVMKTHLSEYMLKKLVGHSAEMDTFGVYGHVIDGEMEQAVRDTSEVFDFWLKGAK